jgi:hypothetical protein
MLRLLACAGAVASPGALIPRCTSKIAEPLPPPEIGHWGANPHFKSARFGYNDPNKQ